MSKFNMNCFNLPKLDDKPIPEELKSDARPLANSFVAPFKRKSRQFKTIEDFDKRYALKSVRVRSEDNVIHFDNYQKQLVTERAAEDLKRRHTDALDIPQDTSAVDKSNIDTNKAADTDAFSVAQTSSQSSGGLSPNGTLQNSSGSSLVLGGFFFDLQEDVLHVPVRDIADDNLSVRSEYSVKSYIDYETAIAAAAAGSTTSESLSPTNNAILSTACYSTTNEALSSTDSLSSNNEAPSSPEYGPPSP